MSACEFHVAIECCVWLFGDVKSLFGHFVRVVLSCGLCSLA